MTIVAMTAITLQPKQRVQCSDKGSKGARLHAQVTAFNSAWKSKRMLGWLQGHHFEPCFKSSCSIY